jgi:hypothetical protein
VQVQSRSPSDLSRQKRRHAAQQIQALVPWYDAELVGCHELASGALVVDGESAGLSFGLAGGAGVDGLFAQAVADPLRGGLLVAAEEQRGGRVLVVFATSLLSIDVHGTG